jgi:AraC-like DNA-binding protein
MRLVRGVCVKERRLIRSAALTGFADAAAEVGLDPVGMLDEVGLSLPHPDNLDRMISFDAFLALLSNCTDRSGTSDFGVRVALSGDIPNLGPVSLLIREADNLEAAIRLHAAYLRLHSDGATMRLDTRFDDPLIVVDVPTPTERLSIPVMQISIARLLRQIRWLIGEEYRPKQVCFAFGRPPHSQIAQAFFQCELAYDQILSGIVLHRSVLRRPLVTSPPFLRKLALKQLRPLLRRPPNSFTLKVKQFISEGLAEGEPVSPATIAEALHIDRRTLNRRLARENATYSGLLDGVRRQIAQRALENRDQSLTELAVITGFQSLSAFSRWFHMAFGVSATEWRFGSTNRD